MFELLLLAVPFAENFLMDAIVPMIALVFVGVLILNSFLGKIGYRLW